MNRSADLGFKAHSWIRGILSPRERVRVRGKRPFDLKVGNNSNT
jgi:hypothetical protein